MPDNTEAASARKQGVYAYEVWKAKLSTEAPDVTKITYEYPLFTDAHITGELTEGLGPYQLLNGLAFHDDHSLRAGIVLRAEFPIMEPLGDNELVTDTDRYHAGYPSDEIAALVSLSLGIRVKPGGPTREFREGNDPRGRPMGYLDYSDPVLLRRYSGKRFVLPRARESHCLNDLTLLPTLPRLTPDDATALVLAARSYQNAIWIAESEPELAWLLLVSAVETAVVRWSAADDSPIEKLKASKPDLYTLLISKGGDELAEQVANEIAPSLGVTSKFTRFLMTFLPDAPAVRPPEFCQIKWTNSNLKKALGKVYGYRSKALHAGKPFPLPACEPPWHDGDPPTPCEIPEALGMQARGATWRREDVPMLLHTFEYIVRNALLKWWKSMVPPETHGTQLSEQNSA